MANDKLDLFYIELRDSCVIGATYIKKINNLEILSLFFFIKIKDNKFFSDVIIL